jgi:hypothetical protein
MAEILNKKEDYNDFMKSSQSWKIVFDWNAGFMRPKKNGGWNKPFDPREINNNFTEGNSWQYSFFVPQDIPGMIEAYGGAAKFEAKLDEMFNSESKTTGREQADVTGLIGQYAHGNEPSHHMAYLYNYVGKPEKTTEKVHFILDNFYKNSPDGLIGNEDCGQMSAWYVLSSMGIYAVTPGEIKWTTVDPNFKGIIINTDKGLKKIDINSSKSYLKFLDTKFEKYATTDDFEVTKAVNREELIKDIIPVPLIQAESKAFKDKMAIDIVSQNPTDKIYYIVFEKDVDYSTIKMTYVPYLKPFYIEASSTIQAYIKNDNGQSETVSAQFYKKPTNYTIEIKSKYNPQYTAGGDEGIIDGINGTENWRKGEWQGYQSQDFEAVINLQIEKNVSNFSATFLQDSGSWILMPTKVDYYVSNDNVNFTLVGSVNNSISPKYSVNKIENFEYKSPQELKAKYVKVKAYNFGKLPDWHLGAGGDAFIFIDEITIK